jgi:hypothetical protein
MQHKKSHSNQPVVDCRGNFAELPLVSSKGNSANVSKIGKIPQIFSTLFFIITFFIIAFYD